MSGAARVINYNKRLFGPGPVARMPASGIRGFYARKAPLEGFTHAGMYATFVFTWWLICCNMQLIIYNDDLLPHGLYFLTILLVSLPIFKLSMNASYTNRNINITQPFTEQSSVSQPHFFSNSAWVTQTQEISTNTTKRTLLDKFNVIQCNMQHVCDIVLYWLLLFIHSFVAPEYMLRQKN